MADALVFCVVGYGHVVVAFSGGVAAWRMGDLITAKTLFEAAWRGADTDAGRAASAFWAARLAERGHDRGSRIFWLRRAASEFPAPRTPPIWPLTPVTLVPHARSSVNPNGGGARPGARPCFAEPSRLLIPP